MYLLSGTQENGVELEVMILWRFTQDTANRWLDIANIRRRVAQDEIHDGDLTFTIKLDHDVDAYFYEMPLRCRFHRYLIGLGGRSGVWRNTQAVQIPDDAVLNKEQFVWNEEVFPRRQCTHLDLIVNARFCRLYGYTFPDRRLGEDHREVVHVDSARIYYDFIEEMAGIKT